MNDEELQKCKQLLCSEDEANIRLACMMLTEEDLDLIVQEERSMLHIQIKKLFFHTSQEKKSVDFKHVSIFNTTLLVSSKIHREEKNGLIYTSYTVDRDWLFTDFPEAPWYTKHKGSDKAAVHSSVFFNGYYKEREKAEVLFTMCFPFESFVKNVNDLGDFSKLSWFYTSFLHLKEMNNLKEYYLKMYKKYKYE